MDSGILKNVKNARRKNGGHFKFTIKSDYKMQGRILSARSPMFLSPRMRVNKHPGGLAFPESKACEARPVGETASRV
ncbi:MAG: hypothetical protein IJM98_05435, partial [Oscillospiraceae bacterium]|nr:hypothetical protein [Oscillospiraceae bacterium]